MSFANVPPTNPPTSFRSSCLCFAYARYSSRVSVLLAGVLSRSVNSDHSISDLGQCLVFLVPAALISSILLFSMLAS